MDNVKIGIIGGSGLYGMESLHVIDEVFTDTPFGKPSGPIIIGELDGIRVAFLPRHGIGHFLTPTEVPYQANIYALRTLGVRTVISVSACGSLQQAYAPGDILIPDQVVDFTKLRKSSFFGEGSVAHVSVADPFCAQTSTLLSQAVAQAGGTVHRGGTYIAIEGPRFSTRAESHLFRSWGMDIIGMTACPEVFLAREAGMCYATMAHVTDYDVWHTSEDPVTVEMVIATLNKNTQLAQRALRQLVPQITSTSKTCGCQQALATALITNPAVIPENTCNKLELLTGDV